MTKLGGKKKGPASQFQNERCTSGLEGKKEKKRSFPHSVVKGTGDEKNCFHSQPQKGVMRAAPALHIRLGNKSSSL